MKVTIELSDEHCPAYAVIYTDTVTEEIQKAVEMLEMNETPLIAQQKDRIEIIRPDEVYMIRVESGDTVIYTRQEKYLSKKRLYEVYKQLGSGFMQISKFTISCQQHQVIK